MVTTLCKHVKTSNTYCDHEDCIKEDSLLISNEYYKYLYTLTRNLRTSERKVFLTIKQYKIKDIYPDHPEGPEDPTHILIVCIRWLELSKFQPLSGLLFKPEVYNGQITDLGKTLGECIKAYLFTLNLISLKVVALVSPPDDYFKIIIRYLTQSSDFETGEEPIKFYSEHFKHVACIYDASVVQENFQKAFLEYDFHFEENDTVYHASFIHVQAILKNPQFREFRKQLYASKESRYKISIFNQNIHTSLFCDIHLGRLPNKCYGTAVLINKIRSVLKYLESDSMYIEKVRTLLTSFNDAIGMLSKVKCARPIETLEQFRNVVKKLTVKDKSPIKDQESTVNEEETARNKIEGTLFNLDKKIDILFSTVESIGFSNKENVLNRRKNGKKKPYNRPIIDSDSFVTVLNNVNEKASAVKQELAETLDDITAHSQKYTGPLKKGKGPLKKSKPYSKKKEWETEAQVMSHSDSEQLMKMADKLGINSNLEKKNDIDKNQIESNDNEIVDLDSSFESGEPKKEKHSLNKSKLRKLKNPYARPTNSEKQRDQIKETDNIPEDSLNSSNLSTKQCQSNELGNILKEDSDMSLKQFEAGKSVSEDNSMKKDKIKDQQKGSSKKYHENSINYCDLSTLGEKISKEFEVKENSDNNILNETDQNFFSPTREMERIVREEECKKLHSQLIKLANQYKSFEDNQKLTVPYSKSCKLAAKEEAKKRGRDRKRVSNVVKLTTERKEISDDVTRKLFKPYSRRNENLDAKSSELLELPCTTDLNTSLLECTSLINTMKIEKTENDECVQVTKKPKKFKLRTVCNSTSWNATQEEDASITSCIDAIINNAKNELEKLHQIDLQTKSDASSENDTNDHLKDNSSKQLQFEDHICTFEYIASIRSMKFALQKLSDFRMTWVKSDIFNCNHIDYFVNIIKKDINLLNVPDEAVADPKCTVFEMTHAVHSLDKIAGNLYCLNQD